MPGILSSSGCIWKFFCQYSLPILIKIHNINFEHIVYMNSIYEDHLLFYASELRLPLPNGVVIPFGN